MPRDGSGVYSAPAGTTATPNTTIESAKYNALVSDLVSDANAARPVTAGGTGATSKQAAVDALFDGTTEVTDENLRIVDPADDTKVAVFDVNGITTATTRTLTVPNASGTLALVSSGSWTPGLLFGGNNSGMAIPTAEGRYVKIGTLVVLQFTLVLSAKGVSTGTATIPNMPFTPIATVTGSGAAFLNDGGFSGLTAGIIFQVSPGSTVLGLRLPRTNGTGSVTDANFTDASNIGGTIVYIAAS